MHCVYLHTMCMYMIFIHTNTRYLVAHTLCVYCQYLQVYGFLRIFTEFYVLLRVYGNLIRNTELGIIRIKQKHLKKKHEFYLF